MDLNKSQRGCLAVLLLALVGIASASSLNSFPRDKQSRLFAPFTQYPNFTSLMQISKRSADDLQSNSCEIFLIHSKKNFLVVISKSKSSRVIDLVRIHRNQVRLQKIYQKAPKFQTLSSSTHHFRSIDILFPVVIIFFLLFFVKNSRIILVHPKNKFQSLLLNLFILCILIKGCHSACNARCQSCSGSTCNRCQQGYYKNGNLCPSYSAITGCAGADGLTCVSCVNGYYLSAVNTCTSCSSVLPGCLRCVGSPALACNQCDYGYALNMTTFECDSCPFYLTDCVACLTRYACTTCVNQTLTVNAAGKCQLCSVKKVGCYKCNSSVCLQCHSGYYILPVKFCTPCNTTLPACVVCPNAMICTQCINKAYVLISNSCIFCGAIYPFCVTCNSLNCLSCQPSFFLNVDRQCECKKGILIENVCVDVAGCEGALQYNGNSYCTECDPSIFYYNTTTVSCDCINGFLLNRQCSVLYGCLAMYYSNNSQVCAMCNRTRHYSKNQTWCSCDRGYQLNKNDNSCYQICGDGILFDLQCDDGNNIDFDGCSQDCSIERGFKCVGGSENSSSKCLNALENFELQVEEIEHLGQYDTGEFEFNILNFHPYFYILNLSKIFFLDIQQNHTVSSLSLRGSKVVFVVDYYEDLEGLSAALRLELISEYFQYPKTINITFAMVSSTSPLRLASYPSAAILEILALTLKGISFLALAVLLFSPCYHKMIALETFTILQICNLAPYLVNGDSIVIHVFDNLSYVNGFGRQLFQNATASEIYGETFEDMSLPKTFAQIMLINESALFGVAIFFVLAFWLRKLIFRFKVLKEKFRHFAEVYCCNLVFSVSMSLYLIFCLALACNNHRVYEKTYKGRLYESTQSYNIINSFLNFTSVFVGLSLISFVGFYNILGFTIAQEMRQNSKNVIIQLIDKEAKRLSVKSKTYVVIYLANLFVTFAFLASLFFFDTKYKVYFYLAASLPFAFYTLIIRPYSRAIDNFGICLGQIISLIFLVGLCVKQYFWIVKVSIPLFYQFYLSMVVISFLAAFVMTAVIRFFFACKVQRAKIEPIIVKEVKKKKYTRFRVENDDDALLVDFKPTHRHDPLKVQEFDLKENPDVLRLKDKLRNDLYEKRNLHRNVNHFLETPNPFMETWLSDDGDRH